MLVLADSLSTRMIAILVAGLAALLMIGAALLIWPTGRGGGVQLYQLPRPHDAQAIVEAIEASPLKAQPAVIRALDTGALRATLAADMPPLMNGTRAADDRDPGYRIYRQALGERPIQIDVRLGGRLRDAPLPGRHALRLCVRLADGQVLILQRQPPLIARHFLGRASLAVAALLAAVLLMLGLAVRQATRPVTLLVREVARFGQALDAKALPLKGPREIRELSAAFNAMQDQIRGLMDERTRMLAAIAHDLRTYLTRLTLRAEFIADPQQRSKAGVDLSEMAQLLDDTLLFAGQDAGRGDKVALVDLGRELEALVALRREMGEAIALAPEAAGLVLASPLALRRMLNNLVDNALRYGSAATVSAGRQGDWIELAVSDDGPGLPEAVLARVTAPFERGDASRNRQTGGAGLGLAIVKALARAQGGDLILSNRPQGGLMATVRLPAGD